MLDKLNLEPIATVGRVPTFREENLTPVCYVKVSKMGSTFLIDEAFNAFFSDAVAKKLSTSEHATAKYQVCIRQDPTSNIIAFTLIGCDGATRSGLEYNSDQLNAAEEIAAIGIKAGSNIELYKASDYTLVARVTPEQRIENPFKSFVNLINVIGEATQRHAKELAPVAEALQRLIGRKVNCLGDDKLARLAARRILADARTVTGLSTKQQVELPSDYREILEAALMVAVSGYEELEKNPARAPECKIDKVRIDTLIKEVNNTYGVNIDPKDWRASSRAWEAGIAKELSAQYFNYEEIDVSKEKEEAVRGSQFFVVTTGKVSEDQYNFETLEQVDETLFKLLVNAGFFVEKNECRRRSDVELPIEASLLQAAINEVSIDPGIKAECLPVETARYYAKFASKNKAVATRSDFFLNFAQLTAALAHAYPNNTLEDCNAFLDAVNKTFMR